MSAHDVETVRALSAFGFVLGVGALVVMAAVWAAWTECAGRTWRER